MRNFAGLLLIFTFATAGTAGPIVVGGGAGESEFSVVFARTNLSSILTDCFSFSCGLTANEKSVYQPLRQRAATVPPAIFKTSTELSQLYRVQPTEVWFNKDLLWLDSARTVPYSVSDSVKLWLEILNLDGAVSPIDLSKLQSRIDSSLQIETSEQAYGTRNSFKIILWKTSRLQSRLFVSSSPDDTTELTQTIVKKISCANPIDLTFDLPTWMSATPTPDAQDPDKIILKLSLITRWTCDGLNRFGFGSAVISVKKNTDGFLKIDPATLDIFIGEQ